MGKTKTVLTKRDIILLKLLSDFGLVSTDQICRFVFKNIQRTTVLRRLRDLQKEKLIRKRGALPNAMAVWVIEPNGVRILKGVPEREHYPIHQLEHEIVLNEIRWKLYTLQWVKSWKTERDLRKKLASEQSHRSRQGWVVPDAVVLFHRFLKSHTTVRLEVELTLKSAARYQSLMQKYHPRFMQSEFFTWYLVKTKSMGMRILESAKKHGGMHIGQEIGFTVIDELLENPFLSTIYYIGGSHPLKQLMPIQNTIHAAQDPAQGLSGDKTLTPIKTAA